MGVPECIGKRVLISGATPVDPGNEVAPFYIGACETTQKEMRKFDKADTQYDLLHMDCYTEDWNAVDTQYSLGALISSPFNQPINGTDICGIRMRTKYPESPERYIGWPQAVGVYFPAVSVTAKEAERYCQSKGGHLPTVAQWEKAMRGIDGSIYGCGNTLTDNNGAKLANYSSDGPTNVGSFPPNSFGVYDGTGNVEEWTLSKDSRGNSIFLGGSWMSGDNMYLKLDFHMEYYFPLSRETIGFRCAFTSQ